jgi:formylmethanofuran:tetrahydromethanopterin formyltransferase
LILKKNRKVMKKYLTSVIAIHNIEGKLGKWPGPIIEANSKEEADEWCKANTQYLFVEQELIEIQKDKSDSSTLN